MVEYHENPPLDNRRLNELFAASWQGHGERDFQPVLARSLGYVAAFEAKRLIGFVNVAWDGGQHAFLLDTTVYPDFQRRGVGTRLVEQAAELARRGGAVWLHVDFERPLARFYCEACRFATTAAGLMKLG
jgi:ribosomal protein S18 acetylase RimI-like enzyme